ncbi:hypothetical protein B0H17DRAFT_1210217 [Mycena rosella]|uniref:Uncharacterized protein n=1 Tax=Mycena rosella TaxID=1033263 RepID=A0AAD7CWM1_MYCRO|nr:hypothetical protein B0H17DRAFT_1210217 [Mycena rosella]
MFHVNRPAAVLELASFMPLYTCPHYGSFVRLVFDDVDVRVMTCTQRVTRTEALASSPKPIDKGARGSCILLRGLFYHRCATNKKFRNPTHKSPRTAIHPVVSCSKRECERGVRDPGQTLRQNPRVFPRYLAQTMKSFLASLVKSTPQIEPSTTNSDRSLPDRVDEISRAAESSLEARDVAQQHLHDAQLQYDQINNRVHVHHRQLVEIAQDLKNKVKEARTELDASEERECQGEHDISAAEDAVAEVEAKIEKQIGGTAMVAWKRSLGSSSHSKPTLPATMDGVAGSPLKAYIQGPQDAPMANSSRRVGGAGDVAPESCEIGGGGM